MTNSTRLLHHCMVAATLTAGLSAAGGDWVRKSSVSGDLAVPNPGRQQTCLVTADFDQDGIVDFAVGERTQTPSVVWYKFTGKSWDKFVIEAEALKPEAGGDVCDIDGDGDLDLILGQDASGSAIWWWENPYPEFSRPWKRRIIKEAGARKHHDQAVGDFDGDGKPELVSWNQGAKQLLMFEIPENPSKEDPWPARTIYSWTSGAELEGFSSQLPDIDGDGTPDLVGGGRWFRHADNGQFECFLIDDAMRFTQCAAGQLVKGGRPEIVFSPGDTDGEACWYEWDGAHWTGHALRHVIHGHTCDIGDVDGDGNLDIMIGEMGNPGAGDRARTFVWYGNGRGVFREEVVSVGQGIHEGRLGDFNGDGRLDILMKPYNHNTPRVDVLLNPRSGSNRRPLKE